MMLADTRSEVKVTFSDRRRCPQYLLIQHARYPDSTRGTQTVAVVLREYPWYPGSTCGTQTAAVGLRQCPQFSLNTRGAQTVHTVLTQWYPWYRDNTRSSHSVPVVR